MSRVCVYTCYFRAGGTNKVNEGISPESVRKREAAAAAKESNSANKRCDAVAMLKT